MNCSSSVPYSCTSSAGECASEDTMASTAATRHRLAPSVPAPTAAHLRQMPQCADQVAAGKEATSSAQHTQQCDSERGLRGSPGSAPKTQEHSRSETSSRGQALQAVARSTAVAGAAEAVKASRDAPGRQMAVRKHSVEDTSAAGLVSPADISAEASDQVGALCAHASCVLDASLNLCACSSTSTRFACALEMFIRGPTKAEMQL